MFWKDFLSMDLWFFSKSYLLNQCIILYQIKHIVIQMHKVEYR